MTGKWRLRMDSLRVWNRLIKDFSCSVHPFWKQSVMFYDSCRRRKKTCECNILAPTQRLSSSLTPEKMEGKEIKRCEKEDSSKSLQPSGNEGRDKRGKQAYYHFESDCKHHMLSCTIRRHKEKTGNKETSR